MAAVTNKPTLDKTQPIFMGMDVHKKTWSLSFVHCGQLIQRATIPAEISLLSSLLERYRGYGVKSVYEAGCFGFHLHYQLIELGIENIVVAVGKMPMVIGDRVKTDRKDSLKLAMFLSQGILRGIYVPPKEQLAVRQLVRMRLQLVRKRACAITQLKHLLLLDGIRLPEGQFTKRMMKEILKMPLAEPIKISVSLHLDTIKHLATQIDALECEAENIATDSEYRDRYLLLSTIPGMGPLTARALLFEVGDWSRFKSEKAIANYFGLTPREYSSGEKVYRGRISGQGKEWLRAMLVQVAWAAVKDKEIAELFARLTTNTGSKKKAIVGVARHLLCRARAMMMRNEIYHSQFELAV